MQPLRVPRGWVIAREGDKKGASLVCVAPDCFPNSRRLTCSSRLPHGGGPSRAARSEDGDNET